jgi:SAM-dependent methyltransferase
MTTTQATGFDADGYKRTTREQWQQAAAAWNDWGPSLETWLGEATEAMLDLSHVRTGDRVLDVAAGAGGQSLAAARRVGPTGAVLATDIAPAILEFLASNARREGLANVATKVMDGEDLDVEPGSYDAVISRLGLIYLPDQQRALAQTRRALRPGGHVAAIVYATPDKNAFFSTPVGIIRRRAALPAPLPGQPGPFSLGAPGAIGTLFEEAGFHDIEVRNIEAPVRMTSAAECTRFERESFGALHQMLSALSDDEREAAWTEIEEALSAFEGSDGFVGPCELVVAAATK